MQFSATPSGKANKYTVAPLASGHTPIFSKNIKKSENMLILKMSIILLALPNLAEITEAI